MVSINANHAVISAALSCATVHSPAAALLCFVGDFTANRRGPLTAGGERGGTTGLLAGTRDEAKLTRVLPLEGGPVGSAGPYHQTSALDPLFTNVDCAECCSVEKTAAGSQRAVDKPVDLGTGGAASGGQTVPLLETADGQAFQKGLNETSVCRHSRPHST